VAYEPAVGVNCDGATVVVQVSDSIRIDIKWQRKCL
jgi:hypothetical protein